MVADPSTVRPRSTTPLASLGPRLVTVTVVATWVAAIPNGEAERATRRSAPSSLVAADAAGPSASPAIASTKTSAGTIGRQP